MIGSDMPGPVASTPVAVLGHAPTATRVYARKKATRGEDVRGAPVLVLSLSRIESLFHLPLGQAAAQIGLCRTALKNACRKCGIARWPFRGRGSRVRRASTVSPSSPDINHSTPPSHDPQGEHELTVANSLSDMESFPTESRSMFSQVDALSPAQWAFSASSSAASNAPPAHTPLTRDAPARVDLRARSPPARAIRADAESRSPPEQAPQRSGFLSSSVGSFLSAEFPAECILSTLPTLPARRAWRGEGEDAPDRIGLPDTPAAVWPCCTAARGVPPAQGGWHLPPPPATVEAGGDSEVAVASTRSPASENALPHVSQTCGFSPECVRSDVSRECVRRDVSVDGGSDLSFLCAFLDNVSCMPG